MLRAPANCFSFSWLSFSSNYPSITRSSLTWSLPKYWSELIPLNPLKRSAADIPVPDSSFFLRSIDINNTTFLTSESPSSTPHATLHHSPSPTPSTHCICCSTLHPTRQHLLAPQVSPPPSVLQRPWNWASYLRVPCAAMASFSDETHHHSTNLSFPRSERRTTTIGDTQRRYRRSRRLRRHHINTQRTSRLWTRLRSTNHGNGGGFGNNGFLCFLMSLIRIYGWCGVEVEFLLHLLSQILLVPTFTQTKQSNNWAALLVYLSCNYEWTHVTDSTFAFCNADQPCSLKNFVARSFPPN